MDADLDGWARMHSASDEGLSVLTDKIIGCAFTVSNALGHGFLEAVYKNALAIELEQAGLGVGREVVFPILYRGENVGHYYADIVVNSTAIIELKVAEALGKAHSAQLLNYLTASHLPVGLLLNFGKPRIEIKRVINKIRAHPPKSASICV
jgi:GxxExxY protein